MKLRTYMVVSPPDELDTYALLVVFAKDSCIPDPFVRYSFRDGSTILSEHISRAEAAPLLNHWRKQGLEIRKT